MAIDLSGRDASVRATAVRIFVAENHPLIKLAGALPWPSLIDLVVEDLKKTTKNGFWQRGRRIVVRIHLGAYLLQILYNLTDRQTEYGIKDNAAFQVFSGASIIGGWCGPDHTSICGFRRRISTETGRTLANLPARHAVDLGFADPSETDFDSTVQEANISYPSDVNLMTKIAGIGRKIGDYLSQKTGLFMPALTDIDMGAIKAKAREYLFTAKNKSIEIKRKIFRELHQLVKRQIRPIIDMCEKLSPKEVTKMPWNIRVAFEQIKFQARRYLLDVGYFVRTQTMKTGKILSFHAKDVTCIKKGKIGKDKEFGRVYQLGRIKGNFLFVLESTSLRMEDKHALIPLLAEHTALFGENTLKSVATDKGYFSGKNLLAITQHGVIENGLQRPGRCKVGLGPSSESQLKLAHRRAGIEPLIGHAKHGGQLRKSRMKSDTATLAAGYGSILGLNLRQMIRCQTRASQKIA